MLVNQRLKQLRGKLTQGEFVAPLGVSIAAISNIEHGKSKMSIDLAKKICEVYGCTMDWLVRGIGTMDLQPTKAEMQQGNCVVIGENQIVVDKDYVISLQSQALKDKDNQIGQLKMQLQTLKSY